MAGAFARAAAVLHRNADISTAAVYGLPSGAALPVRVIEVDQEHEGLIDRSRTRQTTYAFELLMNEVPERPVEWTEGVTGCTISVGAVTYRVFEVSMSNTRKAAWLLYAYAAP